MNPFPKAPQQPTSQQQQLMQLLQSNPELMQKYQQQLSRLQAQSKSSHPPMTSEEYLSKLSNIEKYLDTEGGLVIQPKPAFVIKFMEKRNNEKIFVNIVTHEVIDHPQQKLLVDFQNQPGLRIPMSMGRIREDNDKSGNVCKVVDVVLNPKIVETAQTNPDIMGFTAQIIGNYLLQKHKIAVSQQAVKKVKGVKYKGNKVQVQRVKGKKAPKIEQLSEEEAKAKQKQQENQQKLLSQLNEQQTFKAMKPEFQVLAYTTDKKYELYSLQIKDYEHLKIIIDLPHLIHSKGIHLQGSDKLIYLSVKNIYEICLKMPFEVGKWRSQFSRTQRKMQIFVYRKQEQKGQSSQGKVIKAKDEKLVSPAIVLDNDLLYDLV